MARPIEYNQEYVENTKRYLESCIDIPADKESDIKASVKIPTIEGLAVYLEINRDTIYDWEKKYDEFSVIISRLRGEQADRLINNGLSGTYNSTIAKVLLTKHGYREGIDQTTNDKDLPIPILGGILRDDTNSGGQTNKDESL